VSQLKPCGTHETIPADVAGCLAQRLQLAIRPADSLRAARVDQHVALVNPAALRTTCAVTGLGVERDKDAVRAYSFQQPGLRLLRREDNPVSGLVVTGSARL
jgi:hypothetical protein